MISGVRSCGCGASLAEFLGAKPAWKRRFYGPDFVAAEVQRALSQASRETGLVEFRAEERKGHLCLNPHCAKCDELQTLFSALMLYINQFGYGGPRNRATKCMPDGHTCVPGAHERRFGTEWRVLGRARYACLCFRKSAGCQPGLRYGTLCKVWCRNG